MTAPGQEPDEIMTGKPGGEDDEPRPAPQEEAEKRRAEDEPDLRGIGDNHMPDDVREAERAKTEGDSTEH